MTGAGPDDAVRRALALISEHPGVDGVDAPLTDSASGATTVDVAFRVNLPSEWRRQGESPSGVRSREVVRFDFSAGYPLYPPTLSFREDFTRNLPHMQPWVTNGRPVPCIYDGDTGELLHRDGLAGILNQTSLWLENAALGRLIDPEQGWEPVRRDSFHDDVVADAGHLQGLVDRRGGWRLLKVRYLKFGAADGSHSIHGQLLREVVKVNSTSVGRHFHEVELHGDAGFHRGFSLALIAWPGKLPSGEAIVSDNYYPETVETIDGLKERAAMYGCGDELDTGLRWLEKCLSGWAEAGPFPMPVILLARRPFHLIGSTSPIELCPYIVEIRVPCLFDDGGATAVRAAAHRHTISRPLLAAMAGRTTTSERPRWTLVGAGSLGSKLALHLARAGNGPEVVVDRSGMSPHNAARHALVPATGDMQILWMDAKARSLVQALCGLDQEATAVVADAAAMAMDRKRTQSAWSKKSWAVVNATASLAVREAFGASEWIRPRVVEASLFAGGRVGAITVEGPGRNPSTTDLIVEFYAMLQEEPELSSIVFDDNGAVARQGTGHGCDSLTMPMSDGRLSLSAAGMAEYLLGRQENGLPDKAGEVVIGRLCDDGLGVAWRAERIPAVTVIETKNGSPWRVHLHERALSKMQAEAGRWPDAETGGVLMGRLSEVSRVAHVVDVLNAPEDSERSAGEFILGTQGLRRRLQDYSTAVGWSLYSLGTWHSHLSPGGPSPTDRATARVVSLARLAPSIFVIMTPTGLEALTGDVSDSVAPETDTPVAAGQEPKGQGLSVPTASPVDGGS